MVGRQTLTRNISTFSLTPRPFRDHFLLLELADGGWRLAPAPASEKDNDVEPSPASRMHDHRGGAGGGQEGRGRGRGRGIGRGAGEIRRTDVVSVEPEPVTPMDEPYATSTLRLRRPRCLPPLPIANTPSERTASETRWLKSLYSLQDRLRLRGDDELLLRGERFTENGVDHMRSYLVLSPQGTYCVAPFSTAVCLRL